MNTMAEIRVNNNDVLRIERKKYRNRDVVGIRLWVYGDRHGVAIPTKEVSLRPQDKTPAIVDALSNTGEVF